MSFKFIGATMGFFFGFLSGNLFLALVGAGIGLLIGGSLSPFEGGSPGGGGGFSPLHTSTEESVGASFLLLFAIMGKMASSDGSVSEQEVARVRLFASRDLRLDPFSQERALDIFRQAASSTRDVTSYATEFYAHFSHHREFLELAIDLLLRIAMADGQFHPKEEEMVHSIARIFRLSQEQFSRLKSRYRTEMGVDPYAVLGCRRTDSDEVIKRVYRKKVSEFHPDKIAHKGLPPEFSQFARDKFQEIQKAYETIRKERGF